MNTEKIEALLQIQIEIMTKNLANLVGHRCQFQTFLEKLDPDKLDSNFVEAFKQELGKYERTLADMPLDDLYEVWAGLEAEETCPTCPECGEPETVQTEVDEEGAHTCYGDRDE